MAKHKITDFFQQNMVETNDGIVEPVYHADPGGSDVELQDRELSCPACDECSDKQAVILVTSPTLGGIEPPFQNSGYPNDMIRAINFCW